MKPALVFAAVMLLFAGCEWLKRTLDAIGQAIIAGMLDGQ